MSPFALPCSEDPELWTPDDRSPARRQRAQQICRTECPAAERVQCAQRALDAGGVVFGVWAGEFVPVASRAHREERERVLRRLRVIAALKISTAA